MARGVEGMLRVDKSEGPTSHDVVDHVRKAVGQRRVGHSGTLDPMATGLMLIVLGRATRLVRFLPSTPKVYEGTLRLGLTSDTDDRTGRLCPVSAPLPSEAEVTAASRRLEGRLLQTPPAISARRVGGERLYRLSRSGVANVLAAPTEVEVRRFAVAPTVNPETWTFVAEVSAGTYVRALVRDLGRSLGCGAILTALRRTAIGPLGLAGAVSVGVDRPDPTTLLSSIVALEAMPLDLPRLGLAHALAARSFRHGARVALAGSGEPRGTYAVIDPEGVLLGVGELNEGCLDPCVVLAAVDGAS